MTTSQGAPPSKTQMPTDRPGKRFRVNLMPTSDEPRAAPSPGAYAGHQMIELERLGACPAEYHGRIVRLRATWRPSFAFGGRHFFAPFAAAPGRLGSSSPRRTMAAMVDLLLRRAPLFR